MTLLQNNVKLKLLLSPPMTNKPRFDGTGAFII